MKLNKNTKLDMVGKWIMNNCIILRGDDVLRKEYFLAIIIPLLILSLIGCTKSENVKVISPFKDIPISSTKRIEFSNLTVTSKEKELGRSKMVTDEDDIKKIGEYLKSITCTESNNKNFKPDFVISLLKSSENEKIYLYEIGVSNNQIYVYNYSNTDTVNFIYKNIDSRITQELKSLYNDMNYEEEFLMKK